MNILGDKKMSYEQVIDTCVQVPVREDIVKIETAKTVQWKPISHSNFVEALYNGITHHGLKITDSAFALNKTEQLLVGGFSVEGPQLPALPNGINAKYDLLCRHANDMSHGIQINAGLELMVCTNGVMRGDVIARHKHTSQFDVDVWARDIALLDFLQDCRKQVGFVDTLLDLSCSDAQAAQCILEAGREGVLPLARRVDVWEEWKNPVFSTQDFPLNTAYKLYGDFSHVSQKCSPHRQLHINEKAGSIITRFTDPIEVEAELVGAGVDEQPGLF